ncbi:hypothetical protein [Nocardia noduli]|uniref:hypothetical protein n=1 Tax=Nocardia noduli TaxID=2815722 RepID=UPI001C22EF61|nr:hypothetical protein [Nocardia noduli]
MRADYHTPENLRIPSAIGTGVNALLLCIAVSTAVHLRQVAIVAQQVADTLHSASVLRGSRSGRRWTNPPAMQSILRGAISRFVSCQRARMRAVADIAIAVHSAEGGRHTLTELIDNACNFSPPTTEVRLYAAAVPSGLPHSASFSRRSSAVCPRSLPFPPPLRRTTDDDF